MAPRKKKPENTNNDSADKIFKSDNLKINKHINFSDKFPKKLKDALNKIKDKKAKEAIEKAIKESNINPEDIALCEVISDGKSFKNSDFVVAGYSAALTTLAACITDKIGETATKENKWSLLTSVPFNVQSDIIFKAITVKKNWFEFCRLGLHINNLTDGVADIQPTNFTNIYMEYRESGKEPKSAFHKNVLDLIDSCTQMFWNILICSHFLNVSKDFSVKITETFVNKELNEAATLCSKARFDIIAKIDTMLKKQIEQDRQYEGTTVNSLSEEEYKRFMTLARNQVRDYINSSDNFDHADTAVTSNDALMLNEIIDKLYYRTRVVYKDWLAHLEFLKKNKSKE